jgi:hypothetical protein
MPSVEYTQSKGLVQRNTTSSTLDLQGALSGFREKLETISADKTLTLTDSGKTFMCNDANITVTLPRCTTKGIKYRFILDTNATNDIEVAQSNANDDFEGVIMDGAGTSEVPDNDGAGANDDTLVKFKSGTAVAGDHFEIISSGSKWLISGSSRAANGIQFD